MKPEEKYFVVKGTYESFNWYEREEGYWLYERYKNTISRDRFFKEKEDADAECAKLREKYRQATSNIKEGDVVWFVNGYFFQVRKVIDISHIGDDMYYRMEETDSLFRGDELFKSKQELLEYLDKHINE